MSGSATLEAVPGEGVEEQGFIFLVSLDKIDRNPNNQRKTFKEETLQALARDIDDRGFDEPLVVIPGEDRYQLESGERRYRAAGILGLEKVPCRLGRTDQLPEDQLISLYMRNKHREDLAPVDEARGLVQIAEAKGWTMSRMIEELHLDEIHVKRRLSLLLLPKSVQDMVNDETLSLGDGLVLAAYAKAGDSGKTTPPEKIEELATKRIAGTLTQRALRVGLSRGKIVTGKAVGVKGANTDGFATNRSFTTPEGIRIQISHITEKLTDRQLVGACEYVIDSLK